MDKGQKKKKKKEKKGRAESIVEIQEKKRKISDLDFKSLRLCFQQLLRKIDGLMLPLVKNCRNDKVQQKDEGCPLKENTENCFLGCNIPQHTGC